LLAAVVASLGLLGAGCGGGSKSPAVASLGTTAASSSGGASSKSLFPPGVGGVGASMSTQVGTGAVGVRYTGCMRSHGVPSFPDPDATGTLTITVSPSLNPSSPLFQKAEADCQHLVPAGKRLSAARQQQAKQRALAFAACMRSHGVPKYPDPTFSNGGISQGINRRDVDPSSPSFQAAQKTCRSIGGPS
jgi:hypothetical protein